MPGPERKVEEYLKKQVTKRHGYCIKFIPVIAGMPDRLVFLPGGRIYLVELKARNGRVRAAQRIWHARFHAIGVPIALLYTKEAVDAWLDSLSTPMF